MSRKPDGYAVSDDGHISRMPLTEYARRKFPPEQFRYYYRITAEDRAVLLAAAEWIGVCGQCSCDDCKGAKELAAKLREMAGE